MQDTTHNNEVLEPAQADLGLSSAVPEGLGGVAAQAVVGPRKPHEVLARELGISDKTVRVKRQRGLSDQEIADQAKVLSLRHHPNKRKASGEIALAEPVGMLANADSTSANAETTGAPRIPAAPDFVLAPPAPTPPALGAMAEASLRKEQAEARLKELRLEEEEGRLIDIGTVGQELSRLVRECRDNMLGMASRLAPRVASIADERQVHLLLTEEIEQCLHKVASELQHYAEAA
ncbi:MAG: hypothetical protein K2W93_12985 [Burkholderiaceae bacterium]|nr:hypothetical protein [Burkholderiaceae bacterium]